MLLSLEFLRQRLTELDRHRECNAGAIMILKKQLRHPFAQFPCRFEHAGADGYAWMLFPKCEFEKMEGHTKENGEPGPSVKIPKDPETPTETSYAATSKANWNRENYKNYNIMLAFRREGIKHTFLEGNVLFSKENTVGNLTQYPLDLYDYLWNTRENRDDKDRQIKVAETNLDAAFDPTEDVTKYFNDKQDARYRMIELKQPAKADDATMIRSAILGLEIHVEREKGIEKFREKQDKLAALDPPREATWVEFKTHMVPKDNKIRNNPATKKALGLANSAVEKFEEQSTAIEQNQATAII